MKWIRYNGEKIVNSGQWFIRPVWCQDCVCYKELQLRAGLLGSHRAQLSYMYSSSVAVGGAQLLSIAIGRGLAAVHLIYRGWGYSFHWGLPCNALWIAMNFISTQLPAQLNQRSKEQWNLMNRDFLARFDWSMEVEWGGGGRCTNPLVPPN